MEVLLTKSGDVKLKEIMDDYHALLAQRDIIDIRRDGSYSWTYGTKKMLGKLRSLGLRKSKYRPQGYTHIVIDSKRMKMWGQRYKLLPQDNDTPLEDFLALSGDSLAIPEEPKTSKKYKPSYPHRIQKFLKEQPLGATSFSPSVDELEVLPEVLELGFVEEVEGSPGIWRLTKTGKSEAKKLRRTE